jgi:hypothetical protein
MHSARAEWLIGEGKSNEMHFRILNEQVQALRRVSKLKRFASLPHFNRPQSVSSAKGLISCSCLVAFSTSGLLSARNALKVSKQVGRTCKKRSRAKRVHLLSGERLCALEWVAKRTFFLHRFWRDKKSSSVQAHVLSCSLDRDLVGLLQHALASSLVLSLALGLCVN